MKSLTNALEADLGFGTREGVVATVETDDARRSAGAALLRERARAGAEHARRARRRVRADAAAQPRVAARFHIEGYEAKPGEDMELVINVVSDGYFETMQIPVRTGRTFDSSDRTGGAPVAIVNDLLANRFLRR